VFDGEILAKDFTDGQGNWKRSVMIGKSILYNMVAGKRNWGD
jgi:hypothetical protein